MKQTCPGATTANGGTNCTIISSIIIDRLVPYEIHREVLTPDSLALPWLRPRYVPIHRLTGRTCHR